MKGSSNSAEIARPASDELFEQLTPAERKEIAKEFKEMGKKLCPNRSHLLWSEPNFMIIYNSKQMQREEMSEKVVGILKEKGYSTANEDLYHLLSADLRATPFIWSNQEDLVEKVKESAIEQLDKNVFSVESSFRLNDFSMEVEARFYLENYNLIGAFRTQHKLNKVSKSLHTQFPPREAGIFTFTGEELIPYTPKKR